MAELGTTSASTMADYVLANLKDVTHQKVHKLLYYIEAWHLAVLGKPILDAEFEAWLHGPVVRDLFTRFKYGGEGGFWMYDSVNISEEKQSAAKEFIETHLTDEQRQIIADVLEEYGSKTAYHLECLTHSEEPWIEARKDVADGEASSNIISKNTMKRFYESQLNAK